MKNLTISQFEEMCDSISPKKYVFDTQNQKYQNDKTLQTRLIISFPELVFAHNPDILFFRGENCTLYLGNVKRVLVNKTASVLGTVFDVVCGDFCNDQNDHTYTLIAQ